MSRLNTLQEKNEFLVTLSYACDAIYILERYFNSENYEGTSVDANEVREKIKECAKIMAKLDAMHINMSGW